MFPSHRDQQGAHADRVQHVPRYLVWVSRVQQRDRRHSDFSCMQVSITQLILRISPPAEYEFRIPVFHMHVPSYCTYGKLRAAGDSETLDLTCPSVPGADLGAVNRDTNLVFQSSSRTQSNAEHRTQGSQGLSQNLQISTKQPYIVNNNTIVLILELKLQRF